MIVVGDTTPWGDRARRLEQIARQLETVGQPLLYAGIAGWALLLALLWLRIDQQTIAIVLTLAALLCLAGLWLPRMAQQLEAEAAGWTARLLVEGELRGELEGWLDGSWTFFRPIMPEREQSAEPLDGVLLGPGGCFVLRLCQMPGTVRNEGETWQQHRADGQWRGLAFNPTHEAAQQAERLARALEREGVAVTLLPRIVLSSAGHLLAEGPDVPVWWPAQPDGMRDDIGPEGEARISAELLARCRTLLGAWI
jgi:hypothetical protein